VTPVDISKCPLGLNACVASRELIGLRSNSRGFNIRSAPASSAAVLGPQSDTTDLETVVFAKNKDKRKVVDGNGQGNGHDVNELADSRNANDGEEDVPENNVV